MKSAFVVLNPVAGGNDGDIHHLLKAHFSREGWTHEIHETTGKEQIGKFVRETWDRREGDVDLFVAAGGDGTFSGVAAGLVHTEAAVGILPLGTGNLLARELGIPLTPQAALNLLTGAHTLRWIDAMQVDGDFFVLNVSVGLTGIMMRDTKREDKRRFGRAAYVWTGLRKLLGYQPHRFVIAIDGESRAVRASEVVIANSGAAGDPSLRWGPEVRLDDGQLDVHIIRTQSAIDYLRLAGTVLLGRQRQDPTIQHFVARKRATVADAPSLPVQGDGEFIGWPPMEVEIVPQAIQVVVPRES
jgi:YegS/Rv2252/BmrU family lipid kinase